MKTIRLAALCFFLALGGLLAREPSGMGTVTKALEPFIQSQSLAGAVALVATKDKILTLETAGFADREGKKSMQPDSLFWIASMSKPITGAGLMILVDEGKVRLDDPVEKFLPEFQGIMVITEKDDNHVLLTKAKTPMTVRHILSHTSGMRFSSPLEKPTLDSLAIRDGVRSHALQPLQWEPGSKYLYSNAGINTGGRIIEVVSGMPYEDFMQKKLFDPLGMKDTTFWPNEEQVSRLAKVYRPNAGKNGLEETKISQLTYPLSNRQRQPMPGGGLFSTATDVSRFCQMVLNEGEFKGRRYLSKEAVKAMTSKQTGELKEGYGIGWSTTGNTFGHGGALATNMTIDPEKGLIYVWMVQHSGFPGNGAQAQGAFRKAAEVFAK